MHVPVVMNMNVAHAGNVATSAEIGAPGYKKSVAVDGELGCGSAIKRHLLGCIYFLIYAPMPDDTRDGSDRGSDTESVSGTNPIAAYRATVAATLINGLIYARELICETGDDDDVEDPKGCHEYLLQCVSDTFEFGDDDAEIKLKQKVMFILLFDDENQLEVLYGLINRAVIREIAEQHASLAEECVNTSIRLRMAMRDFVRTVDLGCECDST